MMPDTMMPFHLKCCRSPGIVVRIFQPCPSYHAHPVWSSQQNHAHPLTTQILWSQHQRYAILKQKVKSPNPFPIPICSQAPFIEVFCLEDIRNNTSRNTHQRSRTSHINPRTSIARLQRNPRARRGCRSLRSSASTRRSRSRRRRNDLRDSRASRVWLRDSRSDKCDFSDGPGVGTSGRNARLCGRRGGDGGAQT